MEAVDSPRRPASGTWPYARLAQPIEVGELGPLAYESPLALSARSLSRSRGVPRSIPRRSRRRCPDGARTWLSIELGRDHRGVAEPGALPHVRSRRRLRPDRLLARVERRRRSGGRRRARAGRRSRRAGLRPPCRLATWTGSRRVRPAWIASKRSGLDDRRVALLALVGGCCGRSCGRCGPPSGPPWRPVDALGVEDAGDVAEGGTGLDQVEDALDDRRPWPGRSPAR